MDDITKHGHEPEENPAVSHERSDIDIFAVTKFGMALAIGTVIAVFAMWALFEFLLKHQNQDLEQLPASVVQSRKGLLPPEPRLQTMGSPQRPDVAAGDLRPPHFELLQFRESEKRLLDSYAWVDPNNNIVRIPVDLAKDIVLKKGLPSKVTPEGAATKAVNPGEAVGTSSAAQPQRVFETGGAAVGSTPVTTFPAIDEPESARKK